MVPGSATSSQNLTGSRSGSPGRIPSSSQNFSHGSMGLYGERDPENYFSSGMDLDIDHQQELSSHKIRAQIQVPNPHPVDLGPCMEIDTEMDMRPVVGLTLPKSGADVSGHGSENPTLHIPPSVPSPSRKPHVLKSKGAAPRKVSTSKTGSKHAKEPKTPRPDSAVGRKKAAISSGLPKARRLASGAGKKLDSLLPGEPHWRIFPPPVRQGLGSIDPSRAGSGEMNPEAFSNSGIRPRIWASSKIELTSIVPELSKSNCVNGVSWKLSETPIVLLDEECMFWEWGTPAEGGISVFELTMVRDFTCMISDIEHSSPSVSSSTVSPPTPPAPPVPTPDPPPRESTQHLSTLTKPVYPINKEFQYPGTDPGMREILSRSSQGYKLKPAMWNTPLNLRGAGETQPGFPTDGGVSSPPPWVSQSPPWTSAPQYHQPSSGEVLNTPTHWGSGRPTGLTPPSFTPSFQSPSNWPTSAVPRSGPGTPPGAPFRAFSHRYYYKPTSNLREMTPVASRLRAASLPPSMSSLSKHSDNGLAPSAQTTTPVREDFRVADPYGRNPPSAFDYPPRRQSTFPVRTPYAVIQRPSSQRCSCDHKFNPHCLSCNRMSVDTDPMSLPTPPKDEMDHWTHNCDTSVPLTTREAQSSTASANSYLEASHWHKNNHTHPLSSAQAIIMTKPETVPREHHPLQPHISSSYGPFPPYPMISKCHSSKDNALNAISSIPQAIITVTESQSNRVDDSHSYTSTVKGNSELKLDIPPLDTVMHTEAGSSDAPLAGASSVQPLPQSPTNEMCPMPVISAFNATSTPIINPSSGIFNIPAIITVRDGKDVADSTEATNQPSATMNQSASPETGSELRQRVTPPPRLSPDLESQTRFRQYIPSSIPPEIRALIDAYIQSTPVLVVGPRTSIPLILPETFAYIYLGLFRIIRVQEERLAFSGDMKNIDVGHVDGRVKWRFWLRWATGGEQFLPRAHYSVSRPWWAPNSHYVSSDGTESDSGSTPRYLHQRRQNMNYQWRNQDLNGRYQSFLSFDLLTPLGLDDSDRAFPRGWHCGECGKLNEQVMMRHRRCSSLSCQGKRLGSGYAFDLQTVRGPHGALPLVLPYNVYPTSVELSAVTWQDGMLTLSYSLKKDTPVVVKHISTCNRADLQGEPSALFQDIQRNVELRRESGDNPGPYFSFTAGIGQGPLGSNAIPWKNVPKCVRQAREFMVHQVYHYGELECQEYNLAILAWISRGSKRGTSLLEATKRAVLVLCLGNDVTLTLVPKSGFETMEGNCKVEISDLDSLLPPDSNESVDLDILGLAEEKHDHDTVPLIPTVPSSDASCAPIKSKGASKAAGDLLQVTLVHGDIIVLSGDDFAYSIKRTGTSMLLIGTTTTNR